MVLAVEHDQVHTILILPPQLLHYSLSGRSKSCDPATRLKRHLQTDTQTDITQCMHLRESVPVSVYYLRATCLCLYCIPATQDQRGPGKQALTCLSTSVSPCLASDTVGLTLLRQHLFCMLTGVLRQAKVQPRSLATIYMDYTLER